MLQYKLECPSLEVETGFPVLLSALLKSREDKGAGADRGDRHASADIFAKNFATAASPLHCRRTSCDSRLFLFSHLQRSWMHRDFICGGGEWGVRYRPRGLQRDVVYLGWPIAPSCMSPNAGEWGELRGSQPMSTAVHWTSNSIFYRLIDRKLHPFLCMCRHQGHLYSSGEDPGRQTLKVLTNEKRGGYHSIGLVLSYSSLDFQTNWCRLHPVRDLKLFSEACFCHLKSIIVPK